VSQTSDETSTLCNASPTDMLIQNVFSLHGDRSVHLFIDYITFLFSIVFQDVQSPSVLFELHEGSRMIQRCDWKREMHVQTCKPSARFRPRQKDSAVYDRP
jgi:hypothetical protein